MTAFEEAAGPPVRLLLCGIGFALFGLVASANWQCGAGMAAKCRPAA
jgi:hypothetical protein